MYITKNMNSLANWLHPKSKWSKATNDGVGVDLDPFVLLDCSVD